MEISDAAAVEAVEDKSDITEETVDPVTVTIQEDVEAEGGEGRRPTSVDVVLMRVFPGHC